MVWAFQGSGRLQNISNLTSNNIPTRFGPYQYPVGVKAGTISGTVNVSGVLSRRRIWVHHRESGRLVAETFSDPITGFFAVPNLDPRLKYYALAFDDETEALIGTYDCDAHDGLIPE